MNGSERSEAHLDPLQRPDEQGSCFIHLAQKKASKSGAFRAEHGVILPFLIVLEKLSVDRSVSRACRLFAS